MKAIFILKQLAAYKYTRYEIVPIARMNEFEVHCGELEQDEWYVLCENPQLGKADACGRWRGNSKPFYAYKIDDFE